MPAPFLVAQISDPHVGGDWGGPDPVAGLVAVLEAVWALPDRPDALLVTGDLVEHGSSEEYERVHELLTTKPAPVYVLGGNHDLREGLRASRCSTRPTWARCGSSPWTRRSPAGPVASWTPSGWHGSTPSWRSRPG